MTITGLACPWDTLSADARPPREPAACGLPYHRRYIAECFDASIQLAELSKLAVNAIPLVWTHEATVTLATTADESLRLWNGQDGLMFEARVSLADAAVREVINMLSPRRYGVSLEACGVPNMSRWEFVNAKWTKTLLSAELVHVALEERPAFPQTWVRAEPAALVLPLRNRDPQVRGFAGGGIRISA